MSSQPEMPDGSNEGYDESQKEFVALCQAIGFIVVNWAIIEQQVDNWVNVAFINCGGHSLRKNGDIPRSLSEKTSFLRSCFKKLDSLAQFAEEGGLLVSRVSNIASWRHKLVHGGIMSFEPDSETGGFQFRRIEYLKDNHAVEFFTFDPATYANLETEIGDLLTDQLAFSQKLANEFLEPQE